MVGTHQKIFRLEVAVRDAAFMRPGERRSGLDANIEDSGQVEGESLRGVLRRGPVRMLGWFRAEAARSSCAKRRMRSGWRPSSGRSTLMATSRPSVASCAR